jgi:hypothetical protein
MALLWCLKNGRKNRIKKPIKEIKKRGDIQLLLIVHCPLPIAHCPLPIAY